MDDYLAIGGYRTTSVQKEDQHMPYNRVLDFLRGMRYTKGHDPACA